MTVEELKIMLTADGTGLNSVLGQAESGLKGLGSSVGSIASSIGNGISTVASFGAGIAGVVTDAASGMISMAQSAASTADEIDKMSQKIGISREAYQELGFICSQSGTDVNNLQMGMKQLTNVIDATAKGTSKSATALEELGISAVNADGSYRSTEEVMWEAFSALQAMEDETKKAALATDLFGRSGTELMPMLNGSAGSIEALKQQAHDLGLIMSDELVDNGVNLTDALDQMKRSLAAIGTRLGGSLMPILEKAADLITDNLPLVSSMADSIIPLLTNSFDGLITPLLELGQTLLPELSGIISTVIPQLSEVLSNLVPIAGELIGKLAPVVSEIISRLLPPLLDILDALMPVLDILLMALDPILDLVVQLLGPLSGVLSTVASLISTVLNLISGALQPLMPVIEGVISIFAEGLGTALQFISDYIGNTLIPVFDGLGKFLNGDLMGGIQGFGEGFVGVFESAFSLIDNLFGTNLSKWYSEVTSFWRDVGGKLYETLHGDEINETEMLNKYGGLDDDIVQKSNQYMREGMSAADAMDKAMNEVLDTSEKLWYFDTHLKADMDTRFGTAEERYELVKDQGADYYYTGNSTPVGGSATADYYRQQGEAKLAAKSDLMEPPATASDIYEATSAAMSEAEISANINVDTTVELDGDKVGEAVYSYQTRRTRITGGFN